MAVNKIENVAANSPHLLTSTNVSSSFTVFNHNRYPIEVYVTTGTTPPNTETDGRIDIPAKSGLQQKLEDLFTAQGMPNRVWVLSRNGNAKVSVFHD